MEKISSSSGITLGEHLSFASRNVGAPSDNTCATSGNPITTTAIVHNDSAGRLYRKFLLPLHTSMSNLINAADGAACYADYIIGTTNGIVSSAESIIHTTNDSSADSTAVGTSVDSIADGGSSHAVSALVSAGMGGISQLLSGKDSDVTDDAEIIDLREYTTASHLQNLEKIGEETDLEVDNVGRVVLKLPMTKSAKLMIICAAVLILVLITFVIFAVIVLATDYIHIPGVSSETLNMITELVGASLCVSYVALSLLWISYIAGYSSGQNGVEGEVNNILSIGKSKLKKSAEDQKNVWKSLSRYHDQLKHMEHRYGDYKSSLNRIKLIGDHLDLVNERLKFRIEHPDRTSNNTDIVTELLSITKNLNSILLKK